MGNRRKKRKRQEVERKKKYKNHTNAPISHTPFSLPPKGRVGEGICKKWVDAIKSRGAK
jgi:hypothetical protein